MEWGKERGNKKRVQKEGIFSGRCGLKIISRDLKNIDKRGVNLLKGDSVVNILKNTTKKKEKE